MCYGHSVVLTVRDALRTDVLRRTRLAAGRRGLGRQIRWVHIWPEVLPWPHGGELLLTTGYSWPGEAPQQRRILRELAQAGVAALLFATGRFFPRVSRAILETADRLALPVLEAPSDVAFAEVTEVINREIIRRQFAVIERSEEIHRHLTRAAVGANDLGDICRTLSDLIGKVVAALDSDLRLLARAAPGPDRTASGAGTPWSPPPVPPGLVHELRHAEGAVRVAGPRDRDQVLCPIRLDGDPLGYLCIVGAAGSTTDLDLRAAEHGAVVVALHLLRQRAVASVEERVQNSFVQALIQGELGRIAGLEERARLVGFDPAGRHVVGLLALLGPRGRKRVLSGPEEFHLRERLDRALRAALRASGLPVLVGYLMNQVVFLLPAPDDPGALRTRVASLWQRVRALEPAVPCAMAMGSVQAGASGVAGSYADADSALAASHGEGLFWHEDLLLLRILRSVADRQALRDLQHRTLGRLREARRGEALCATVQALIQHGFNRRAAARALRVHWNTLRHRIARIEALLERSLADAETRLALQLAAESERLLPAPAGSVAPGRAAPGRRLAASPPDPAPVPLARAAPGRTETPRLRG